jgi:hypothetical protein
MFELRSCIQQKQKEDIQKYQIHSPHSRKNLNSQLAANININSLILIVNFTLANEKKHEKENE